MLDLNVLKRLDRANAAAFYIDRHIEEGRGDRIAIRFQDRSITYSALADEAGRAGSFFSSKGIDMENRVVIVLPDCPLFVSCIFGLMRIGAVPVPVSNKLSLSDYLYIIADCRPKAVIVIPEHRAVMEEIRSHLSYPEHIWVAADPGADETIEDGFDAELAACEPDCPLRDAGRDDMALFQYTSGSTGTPKGVVHLHRGLLELSPPIVEQFDFNEDDVFFSAAKLSFGYGLGNSALFPLSVGASAVLFSGRVDPYNALNAIDRYRPTVFCAVPSLYAAMLDVPNCESAYEMSSLRRCISAGERLSGALYEKWMQTLKLELLDAIGATECLHVFITNRPGQVTPGRTGVLVRGIEARLLDDAGNEVPTGETGHLEIKSPANAARYWNKQEQTRNTMRGPWTRTGDQFTCDGEGVYTFIGRSDDVIKVQGLKIVPSEVEECIMQHEAVMECAVIGVTDEEGITSVQAYIRLNEAWEPGSALSRSLKKHVKDSIAPHKCPRKIHFVEDFPRTSTGKLARFKLREMHQSAGIEPGPGA